VQHITQCCMCANIALLSVACEVMVALYGAVTRVTLGLAEQRGSKTTKTAP